MHTGLKKCALLMGADNEVSTFARALPNWCDNLSERNSDMPVTPNFKA